MIIVFGQISMDMVLRVADLADANDHVPAVYDAISPGGKAASQALAAARSGAKAALVGKIGDDEFSSTILTHLRKEGVITNGIAMSDSLPTGVNIRIHDPDGNHKLIAASGANDEISADQVPDEVLNNKSFLLLQTEIRSDINTDLLARARKGGATTLMNLAPSIDLSQKALNNLDYLIVNMPEAEKLAKKIGIGVENDALKLAQGLSKQGNVNCIVTLGARGAVACTREGVSWQVNALNIGEVVDRAGAEDAYCGTLAACLQTSMPLPRAMKRASIAASLACTKKGGMTSIPYLTDIDARINDLPDPVQIKPGKN